MLGKSPESGGGFVDFFDGDNDSVRLHTWQSIPSFAEAYRQTDTIGRYQPLNSTSVM
jgi:hypothetical protein